MARDYKNTPKPKNKKTSQSSSPWLWMLSGLVIGLSVALVVFVQGYSLDDTGAHKQAPVVDKSRFAEAKPQSSAANKSAQPAEDKQAKKPRFDFYNLLPEMEVFIPDQDIEAEREKNSTGEQVVYDLQVGSFQSFEDADRLRARLALSNFESHIQRISITGNYNTNQTWHRVRVGPFKSAREMGKVRNQLRDQGLEPIILKTVLKPDNTPDK